MGKRNLCVKKDVWGEVNGKEVVAECFFYSKQEAAITAKIAAAVVERVYQMNDLKGVYHLEELFDIYLLRQEIVIPEVKIKERPAL